MFITRETQNVGLNMLIQCHPPGLCTSVTFSLISKDRQQWIEYRLGFQIFLHWPNDIPPPPAALFDFHTNVLSIHRNAIKHRMCQDKRTSHLLIFPFLVLHDGVRGGRDKKKNQRKRLRKLKNISVPLGCIILQRYAIKASPLSNWIDRVTTLLATLEDLLL